MPGEKHHIAGPVVISGAIALHAATKVEPRITGGFVASASIASCTASCGLIDRRGKRNSLGP